MSKSVLAAVLFAGAVVLPSGVAQAQPRTQSSPPANPPGMHQMHERMQEGNPGMARMHELMKQGNPGMARMHELMKQGNPAWPGCASGCTLATEPRP